MPNLRSKTWTATTPAQTVDANFWESHLIDDESYEALQDLIEGGGGGGLPDDLYLIDIKYENASATIDHTYQDILTAYNAGKNIIAFLNGKVGTCHLSGTTFYFESCNYTASYYTDGAVLYSDGSLTYSSTQTRYASTIGVINVDSVITNNVQTSLANLYDIAKRTVKDITLSASNWANGTYTISDTDITATNVITITYPVTTSDGNYSILQAAAIRATGQAAGSLTLKATGTVPTTDITITLVIQGA